MRPGMYIGKLGDGSSSDDGIYILIKEKKADILYETSRAALSRDGGEVIVAILDKQWFLDFNAEGWKIKANKLLKNLQLWPDKYRKQFEDVFQQRHRLTPRETQILKLISLAMTYKEIADQLFISDQTVMVHKKNIMRKLNMSNTAGLIKFALDHNLA